ncbi:hypothetical protein B0T20DRAFT_174025 [Sordaria brevicollis]|uniref:Uncharacterized protein n=1 Tax=Sordaria brevicollis TaxID=83679 RepID=A0AAE0UDB0_SORBR|nr:hypothetical protein B0T20DRAFT_174025 [Sordaria brevicollis]
MGRRHPTVGGTYHFTPSRRSRLLIDFLILLFSFAAIHLSPSSHLHLTSNLHSSFSLFSRGPPRLPVRPAIRGRGSTSNLQRKNWLSIISTSALALTFPCSPLPIICCSGPAFHVALEPLLVLPPSSPFKSRILHRLVAWWKCVCLRNKESTALYNTRLQQGKGTH